MGPVTSANSLYRNLYGWFEGLLPEWLAYLLTGVLIAISIASLVLGVTTFFTWVERRVLGRFQVRLGPNRWGPWGILQPIADAIKLLTKEDIRPEWVDRWVFNLAPMFMFVPAVLVFAVIPLGKNTYVANLNVGILFIMSVTTVSTIAIFMAGWASGNRYSLFGAMRAVAQLISYEVPMALSIVGVVLLAGSLSLVDLVDAQRIPYILLQPLGFLIFFLAASAEMNRSPFDLVEAESEIVAGYHTEYSGMKFGLFQVAEFAAPLGASAIMATLFLKGWVGPWQPPADSLFILKILFSSHLWFFIKVCFFWFLLLWVRATLPRLRVDQVMGLAWKALFPLGLLNLFITAAEVLVWKTPTDSQLWIVAGINWGVAIISLVVVSRLASSKLTTRAPLTPALGRRPRGLREVR